MKTIGFRRSAALAAIVAAVAWMLPILPAQADTAPRLFASNVGNRVVALSTPTQLFPSYLFIGCESDQPIARWTFELRDGSGALVRTIAPTLTQQECTPTRAAYAPFDGTDAAGRRLADGSYTLRVTATDAVGLVGTLDAPFEVDTRIPGYLVSPQPGAQLSGLVALNVMPAQSTQVRRVDYRLSGCGQTRAESPGPRGVFSAVLDVNGCPSGSQTLSTTIEWIDAYDEPHFYEFDVSVVVRPTLQLTAAPVVSGTPNVGERFAGTSGTWSPRNVSISFQWLSDGVPLSGATQATYYPVAADVGKRLSVAVTASRPGYQSRTVVSQPSEVIRLGRARISPSPYIDGTPRVGSTLLGYGGTSSRGPLTLSLQWLRDGTAIRGATGETYTLIPADAGARIRLRLTVSGPGYIPTTATSSATAPVAAQ